MKKKLDLKQELRKMFFNAPNGWKLCSESRSNLPKKIRKKLEELPLTYGRLAYIDDCACMLDGGLGHGNCQCSCHKEINYYVKKIMEIIKNN